MASCPGVAGCKAGRRTISPSPGSALSRVDASFARALLSKRCDRTKLLQHDALGAIVRHERLAGNAGATAEELLDRVLESVEGSPKKASVLDAWDGRERELIELADAASLFLPSGSRFTGTIYLVIGYDIGVAAPPDIVLNVAHEHFLSAPSELGYYVVHEAHHVGFLRLRPAPSMTELSDPEKLQSVIRYMTQLEGMGVHAAFPPRRERGHLEADGDYRVYVDPAEARRVTTRYADLIAPLAESTHLSDREVGTLLGAMSSSERIWYRFGALVCQALERERGRRALIDSIQNPKDFEATAATLLHERSVTW